MSMSTISASHIPSNGASVERHHLVSSGGSFSSLFLEQSACSSNFAPGDVRAILVPRPHYIPKIPFIAVKPVILQAFFPKPHDTQEQEILNLLYPVHGPKDLCTPLWPVASMLSAYGLLWCSQWRECCHHAAYFALDHRLSYKVH